MFKIDRDRLHLVWSPGDYDLAHAFMEIEGFAIATFSGGAPSMIYRCEEGLERKIAYKKKVRTKDRK